uniref:Uncharacterized protein n=1 Tax=Kalanchoe fedtschenkoi TaxID=63787 RepID=A0A7N0V9B8_KALFE
MALTFIFVGVSAGLAFINQNLLWLVLVLLVGSLPYLPNLCSGCLLFHLVQAECGFQCLLFPLHLSPVYFFQQLHLLRHDDLP